jgi:hypothetical protein
LTHPEGVVAEVDDVIERLPSLVVDGGRGLA